jgi:glycerate 2-kinase
MANGTRAWRHGETAPARIPTVSSPSRRETLEEMLRAALVAVDPEPLTRKALDGHRGPVTLVGIGKGAAAMCRGAASAIGEISGICVADHPGPVPEGVELILGDHPIPGDRSFHAGRRALEVVSRSPHRVLTLISGGGSALCEQAPDGLSPHRLVEVTRTLLDAGASIDDLNLVRRHMSAIKGGGLARAATAPLETYAISDVCGSDPAVIASGPTVASPRDPEAALAVLADHDIRLSEEERAVIIGEQDQPDVESSILVLADGRTAAEAAASAARSAGVAAEVMPGWLRGNISSELDRFLSSAPSGVVVIASGEPEVAVTGDGIGGRNTHAALMAAERISGTGSMFVAFATDGVDGSSEAAGAIVGGDTVARGGDPGPALTASDSATYLEATGDLIVTGPTGTNVSDLWIFWP